MPIPLPVFAESVLPTIRVELALVRTPSLRLPKACVPLWSVLLVLGLAAFFLEGVLIA